MMPIPDDISIIVPITTALKEQRKYIGNIFGMDVYVDPNLDDEIRFVNKKGKIVGKIVGWLDKVEQYDG